MATIINLSNTTPAAPSGTQNVLWQGDANNPRNASAALPPPTTSLMGGIKAIVAVAHKWITSIDTSGNPVLTQPDFADLTVTPSTARATLGAAASGANGDITSLTAIGSGGIASSGAITGTLGGWQTWTPTLTPGASMTIAAHAISSAEYLRVGNLLNFKLAFTITFGGTAAETLAVSVPTAMVGDPLPISCVMSLAGVPEPAAAFVIPATPAIVVYMVNSTPFTAANFALGVSYAMYISGAYRVA